MCKHTTSLVSPMCYIIFPPPYAYGNANRWLKAMFLKRFTEEEGRGSYKVSLVMIFKLATNPHSSVHLEIG